VAGLHAVSKAGKIKKLGTGIATLKYFRIFNRRGDYNSGLKGGC